MHTQAQHAQRFEQLLNRDSRYPIQAYGLVLSALQETIHRLPQPRHISGQELAEGLRCHSVDQFGPMAGTVLDSWNIRSTEDIGAIVFNLIEIGLLTKNADDRLEHFQNLYNFKAAFESPYPYLS